MSNTLQDPTIEALWPQTQPASLNVFVILDGARDERICGVVDGTRLLKTAATPATCPGRCR